MFSAIFKIQVIDSLWSHQLLNKLCLFSCAGVCCMEIVTFIHSNSDMNLVEEIQQFHSALTTLKYQKQQVMASSGPRMQWPHCENPRSRILHHDFLAFYFNNSTVSFLLGNVWLSAGSCFCFLKFSLYKMGKMWPANSVKRLKSLKKYFGMCDLCTQSLPWEVPLYYHCCWYLALLGKAASRESPCRSRPYLWEIPHSRFLFSEWSSLIPKFY